MRGANTSKVKRARALRRKMTDAEIKLWNLLRGRRLCGFKFVRQEPIGPFIADFCCREQKIVIEADGVQHADSKRDVRRDALLKAKGYRVIRLWNHEILQSNEVAEETILAALSGGGSSSF